MPRKPLNDRLDFEICYEKDHDGTEDQHRARGFLYDRTTGELVHKDHCLGDDRKDAEDNMLQMLKDFAQKWMAENK